MRIRNARRAARRLRSIPAEYRRGVQAALLASVAEMNSLAITEIQANSGSGRTYGRGRRQHIASAPGEYPNTDTGELVRKMFFRLSGPLTAIWGNSAQHALPLELGTSRMAARPFIWPTFIALHRKAADRVGSAVGDALKAAARGR
ncbi:MAG: hypothetical protein R3D70_05865 [Rhizobiaceae bacterium]